MALEWTNLLPTCPGCNKGFRQHIVTADMSEDDVAALQAVAPQAIHGKATQFPVGEARLTAKSYDHEGEAPHLIDPTRTDPEPELRWRCDTALSVVEPAVLAGVPSLLGQATIHCVALNRADLVMNRTQVLGRLKAQRIKILDDLESDVAEAVAGASHHLKAALRRVEDMKLACEPDEPFSGMAKAFVQAFRRELVAWAEARGFAP
ncbi:hypothetical protein D3C72_1393100 [compost metagenome]